MANKRTRAELDDSYIPRYQHYHRWSHKQRCPEREQRRDFGYPSQRRVSGQITSTFDNPRSASFGSINETQRQTWWRVSEKRPSRAIPHAEIIPRNRETSANGSTAKNVKPPLPSFLSAVHDSGSDSHCSSTDSGNHWSRDTLRSLEQWTRPVLFQKYQKPSVYLPMEGAWKTRRRSVGTICCLRATNVIRSRQLRLRESSMWARQEQCLFRGGL